MGAASTPQPLVNVAVAVVQRSDGCVLLAERPHGKSSGGFWEFPGGKFEITENARQALAREVREEIGIEIDRAYPWMTYEHAYPGKRVRLHFYRILAWHGTPHGREGQRVSWEDPQALGVGPLLPANERVLRALSLPALYAITHARKYGVAAFMDKLRAALKRGVQLIQVREPEMTPEQLAQFARRVVVAAHAHGARVLINGSMMIAQRAGADGVHFQSRQLQQLTAPPALAFWAASCHNSAELARAAELHASFAVLSPVLPTASHPGVPGMGWEKFAALTHHYPLPVYALGGMRADMLETAMDHGAHGVALLTGCW
ncbi:MAG: Nudix family hydrolase [Gammaproteobacteria bacterium]|nr:MAG: Nudix family hydrolase [Gammaproteobacteria bacterium]